MNDEKPQVREYAGPTILIGIVILAGLGIGLIWGLDPRWLYSAAVVYVLAFVLAAASDGRRLERARRAVLAELVEREAMDGPFDQAVPDFSKTSLDPVIEAKFAAEFERSLREGRNRPGGPLDGSR